MPLKLRTDLHCLLIDKKTGNTLLSFTAQQVGDVISNASFESSGVASKGQIGSIQTEANYHFNAMQHEVKINGERWIITNVRKSMRKTVGAFGKSKTIYVLDLE